MQKITHNNISWLDFESISQEDIEYLHENFSIHPLALEELMLPSFQPKVMQYENCLYFSIHIPLFDRETQSTFSSEIDILLSKENLITAHKHPIYQITNFQKQLMASTSKQVAYLSRTPAHLLHHILEVLFQSCFPKLEHIHRRLDEIEEAVFAGREKEMVREISVVKRDILNFRRTLKPQRSILQSLIAKKYAFIPDEMRVYFEDLIGTNERLWNILESHKETIEALEETNNSLLSNKLNMTMKVLTIFSALALPATVYSNVLAMSANIPFANHPQAFWIHVSIMAMISLGTILLFRLKKWL